MRTAMRAAEADFAMVALRVDADRLIIHDALGPLAEDMVGNLMRVRDSVAAPVFETGTPLLVSDYPDRGAATPSVRAQIGSVAVVPLTAEDRVEGALAVGRLVGERGFVQLDVDQLTAFVQRTGTARELRDAQEERRIARLVEERARIRDDLHDNVIQELYAAGMALSLAAEDAPDSPLRSSVLAHIDTLDATTRRIRALISGMPGLAADGLVLPAPKRIVAIVESLTPALRCLPTVAFRGPVEATLQGQLAHDLEAVLREALSNVARHADATAVQVKVGVGGGRVRLEVLDNGRGIDAPERSSGLANMSRRAGRHQGEVHFLVPDGGGTHLVWDVSAGSETAEPG
jgi:signal transduction histidine kinase